MNTVNASTGFSPFQLHIGRSPRLIPPLTVLPSDELTSHDIDARRLIDNLEHDVLEAQDNLFLAKSNQAHQADKHRSAETVFNVGDRVLLSTFHRRREYLQRGQSRVAK
ncbi:hypothetical protein K474DRAFT_1567221, partial [Panus rudis PR-1116 ss-1]